jgi:hypothetical protein
MSQRKRCGSHIEPLAGHGRGPRWAADFFVIVFDSFASLLPPIRILQLADSWSFAGSFNRGTVY